MVHYLLDLLFFGIVGAVCFVLAQRSLVQVATIGLAVLISSLLALICFEPVSGFIVSNMFLATDEWVYCYAWFACLLSVFALSMLLILMGANRIFSGMSAMSGRAETCCRWGMSLFTAYLLAAFLLTSLHTFPGNRDLAGLLPPELDRRQGVVQRLAPDYQLLTLAEFVCTPRAPLTGSPWKMEGPLVEASIKSNRWSSFPVRYALWREGVILKLYQQDLPYPEDEYDDTSDAYDNDMDDIVPVRHQTVPQDSWK
ncbi:MAG TPA: hypothetical protein DDW52_18295 [Planctomycetaceae bacterium]|nr:hypothetical protein [Planctomycetaceae bacterium]